MKFFQPMSLSNKIKFNFKQRSLANQFPQCETYSQEIVIFIPLTNFEFISKNKNVDIVRYYLDQVNDTLLFREAEELFKLLSPSLKKGSKGKIFSGSDSQGIFVPTLNWDEQYQIPENLYYSIDISFKEIREANIDRPYNNKLNTFVIMNLKIKVGK